MLTACGVFGSPAWRWRGGWICPAVARTCSVTSGSGPPRRRALRGHRQHGVTHQPAREARAQRPKMGGRLVAGKVERGAVLHRQHQWVLLTPARGLGKVSLQEPLGGAAGVLKDPMRRL